MICHLISKRASIEIAQLDINSFDLDIVEHSSTPSSKKDLFLFHRKKNEVSEFIKAKSVVNLEEINDAESEISEEKE